MINNAVLLHSFKLWNDSNCRCKNEKKEENGLPWELKPDSKKWSKQNVHENDQKVVVMTPTTTRTGVTSFWPKWRIRRVARSHHIYGSHTHMHAIANVRSAAQPKDMRYDNCIGSCETIWQNVINTDDSNKMIRADPDFGYSKDL